jgi:hypothetical protein
MGADQGRARREREVVRRLHGAAHAGAAGEAGVRSDACGGRQGRLSGPLRRRRGGRQALQKFTTIFLDADETSTLRARETTELLHYGLPDLSDLEISVDAVQAAE